MNVGKKNLIYLTGFMGSGKSTLAPILANTLGYTHLDVDQEIERVTGKTVAEIFRDNGEEYFREIEHRVLLHASKGAHCIISLGGGTITKPANLAIAKSTGILIYLKTGINNIFQRMKHKTDRPLLQMANGERFSDDDLLKRITAILEVRESFYNQADIIIETGDRRVGITVDDIVRALSGMIE